MVKRDYEPKIKLFQFNWFVEIFIIEILYNIDRNFVRVILDGILSLDTWLVTEGVTLQLMITKVAYIVYYS